MVFVGDLEQYSAVKTHSGLLATLFHELPDAVELTEVFRQRDTGKRNQLPPVSGQTDIELDTWFRAHNPYDCAETARLTGEEGNLNQLNQTVLAEHARFARSKVESLTWQEASITTRLHEDKDAALNEVQADYQQVVLTAGRIRAYEQAMADHSAALREEEAARVTIEHQRLLADDYTRSVAEQAYDHDAAGYGTYQQRIDHAHKRLEQAQQRRSLAQQAIEDTGANLPEAGLWDEICYRADDTEEWGKRLNAAAQRTYELRRLGVDEPAQEAIRDMVAETIAAAYEPDNDDTHHDEQDTTVQNTVEEAQPAPETTTEDESTDNAQDEDTSELNGGARASLDFIASLGLDDEQQSDTTDEQAPADELEEKQGLEL